MRSSSGVLKGPFKRPLSSGVSRLRIPLTPLEWWGAWVIAWSLGAATVGVLSLQLDWKRRNVPPSEVTAQSMRILLEESLGVLSEGLEVAAAQVVPGRALEGVPGTSQSSPIGELPKIFVSPFDQGEVRPVTPLLRRYGVTSVGVFFSDGASPLVSSTDKPRTVLKEWLSEVMPDQVISSQFKGQERLQGLLKWKRSPMGSQVASKDPIVWVARKWKEASGATWVVAQIQESLLMDYLLSKVRASGIPLSGLPQVSFTLVTGQPLGMSRDYTTGVYQTALQILPLFPWALLVSEQSPSSLFEALTLKRSMGVFFIGLGFAFFCAGAFWVLILRRNLLVTLEQSQRVSPAEDLPPVSGAVSGRKGLGHFSPSVRMGELEKDAPSDLDLDLRFEMDPGAQGKGEKPHA
jgi:hypothetical protein